LNGYAFDPVKKMCIYGGFDTGASACPSGFSFSSQEKCCVAVKDYQPICAPGFYYSPLGCIAYHSTYNQVDQVINLKACGANPGGGSTCNLACPAGMYPDPTCTACSGKP
jgi:hypothetical protein